MYMQLNKRKKYVILYYSILRIIFIAPLFRYIEVSLYFLWSVQFFFYYLLLIYFTYSTNGLHFESLP